MGRRANRWILAAMLICGAWSGGVCVRVQAAPPVVSELAPDLAALVQQLKSTDEGDRVFAAYALAGMGKRAAQAIPQLAPLLQDANLGVRIKAANALGGRFGYTAIPQLTLLRQDPDPAVRRSADAALQRLGPKP
jgi:HEAT repeat protein